MLYTVTLSSYPASFQMLFSVILYMTMTIRHLDYTSFEFVMAQVTFMIVYTLNIFEILDIERLEIARMIFTANQGHWL